MATRKDFEAVAASIRNSGQSDEAKRAQAEQMAEYLATTNPRFNRELFIAAAMGETKR